MLDELFEHKRQLHKLALDADYLREKITKELEGKDGFGTNTQEHLRQWNQLLNESFENFNVAYDFIVQIIEHERSQLTVD